MITLIEAFKLCKIGEEGVYLRVEKERNSHYFWSKKIRDKFDMKKIQVVGIEPKFEYFGNDFLGMCFTVRGITEEQLCKVEYKI